MSKVNKKPHGVVTRESIRQFEPISSLSNERLDELVSLSYVESISMGVSIFREGDVDNQTIYLLNGDVQLTSSCSGTETIIHSQSKDGKFPLDDSQPRQFSAVAMSSVEIVRIDNSVLDYMMMWDQLAVAEVVNNEILSKEDLEPDKKAEQATDNNVEKLVEQAVLDSIEDAKELDGVDEGISGNTVDFTQTIKPELNAKNIEVKKFVVEKSEIDKPKSLGASQGENQAKSSHKDENKSIDTNTQSAKIDVIQLADEKPVYKKQTEPRPESIENITSKKNDGVDPNTQTVVIDVKKEYEERTKAKSSVNSNSQTTVNEAIKNVSKKTEDKKPQAANDNKKESSIVYESRDWIRKIRQIMAFKNMPPANVKNLLAKMETVNVKKGDRIIEQGDVGDYYYIVTDGSAVVTRTIELAKLTAGTSFGEEALVAKSPRNASVSMTSDGILMRLSKKDFDELLIEPMMAKVSPDEARSKVLNGAKWLDVRHAKEFHHSRLPGAINIPLHELRLRMAELDTETEYICCCRTGTRSSSGSFLLAQNGFKVSLLSGGIQVMSQDLRR